MTKFKIFVIIYSTLLILGFIFQFAFGIITIGPLIQYVGVCSFCILASWKLIAFFDKKIKKEKDA